MRHRLFVAFASIIVALQTFGAFVFGQTTEPSYTFVTVDVPLPNGQLGFTDLTDINEGQIVGGFTDSLLGPYGFLLNFKNPSDPINPFLSHGFVATPEVNSPLVATLTTTTAR
jgi:hypothetical protein